jgi:hypothetical protein
MGRSGKCGNSFRVIHLLDDILPEYRVKSYKDGIFMGFDPGLIQLMTIRINKQKSSSDWIRESSI